MAGGSTLDPDNLPGTGSGAVRTGNDMGSLGPSDTTDTGSDIASGSAVSAEELDSDSDAAGTGARAGVGSDEEAGSDIGFDQVVDADDAGLGTGLDEAELARGQD
ncbi:MAG TPA: hypothetical protein VEY69_06120 [Lautropia sp.]|nr:hypothetical protein [Lautropia sp.]